MIFRKAICEHQYSNVGRYYKEILTEYRNCFDMIVVYQRKKCNKCGVIKDMEISVERFLPELYETRDKRKDGYIKLLRHKGIYTEIEMLDKMPANFDMDMVLEQLEDYGKYKGILCFGESDCENYIPVSVAKQIVRGCGIGGVLGYVEDSRGK